MDSLVTITKPQEKEKLLGDFRTKFKHVQLSKPVKNGTKTVISATDPLDFMGYFIYRRDLIRFVASLSEKIFLPDHNQEDLQTLLGNLLIEAENNSEHPLNSSNDNKTGIAVDFGYGKSDTVTVGKDRKSFGNEIHLVITAIKNGRNVSDNSFTTAAKSDDGGQEITPPNGGIPHPVPFG